MIGIEIDYEVFRVLTLRRTNAGVTYNDVLREILGLKQRAAAPSEQEVMWTWKGVTLPNGTELRAEYKGRIYTAKIENGLWMQDGVARTSPSDAAGTVRNRGTNGWLFWSVRCPGDSTWMSLSDLRPGNNRTPSEAASLGVGGDLASGSTK